MSTNNAAHNFSSVASDDAPSSTTRKGKGKGGRKATILTFFEYGNKDEGDVCSIGDFFAYAWVKGSPYQQEACRYVSKKLKSSEDELAITKISGLVDSWNDPALPLQALASAVSDYLDYRKTLYQVIFRGKVYTLSEKEITSEVFTAPNGKTAYADMLRALFMVPSKAKPDVAYGMFYDNIDTKLRAGVRKIKITLE
jgi:hypothetical protein